MTTDWLIKVTINFFVDRSNLIGCQQFSIYLYTINKQAVNKKGKSWTTDIHNLDQVVSVGEV